MRKMVVAVLVSALSLVAADVTGKWSGSLTPDKETESKPVYIILKQDGAKLTGSGGPDADKQHPTLTGKVEGDKVTFEVRAGSGTFYFNLEASGDEMSGDLRFKGEDETRTAKVSLKRVIEK
jgi:hypothetical protein